MTQPNNPDGSNITPTPGEVVSKAWWNERALCFQVEQPLAAELMDFVRSRGVPLGQIIEGAVREYLHRHDKRTRRPNSLSADKVSAAVIAGRVRFARRRARLTQIELSARSGVDQPVISQIEGGKLNPPKEQILRIGEVLGVDLLDDSAMQSLMKTPAPSYAVTS